jgi:hypothetical protein
MNNIKNIKIANAREVLGVGTSSVEIEDEEKHLFIADAKNKDEIIKNLKPSLIVSEGETALRPLIYTLPDGVVIKGLSNKTKDSKIIGIMKVELSNGLTFMHGPETEYSDFDLFRKEVDNLTASILASYVKYNPANKE